MVCKKSVTNWASIWATRDSVCSTGIGGAIWASCGSMFAIAFCISCCATILALNAICSIQWDTNIPNTLGDAWTKGVTIRATCVAICASWSCSGKAVSNWPAKALAFSMLGSVGCGSGAGGKISSMFCTSKAWYILLYAACRLCSCGLDCANCNCVCANVIRCAIEKILGSETGRISTRSSKSDCLIPASTPVAYGYDGGILSRISRARILNSVFCA